MRVLLPAVCFAALLRAQDPAGVVEGTVVDSVTRRPLAGAALTLRGSGLFRATSGADGGFRFERLDPGIYTLVVTIPGYIDSGQRRSAERVELKSGSTERLTVELVPLAIVEGTILSEEGDPIAGVLIYNGSNQLGTSDEQGRYRLEGLHPGEYRFALRVPFETRRKTVTKDHDVVYGYANTQYYPNGYERSSAIPVSISAGSHLRRFEMRLRRTRLVSLAGHTIQAEVELVDRMAGLQDATYEKRRVDAEGRFRFDLIRPGAYSVWVYRDEYLPYIAPVSVGNTGIEDLAIHVPPAVSVEGAVRTADGKTPWEGSLGVSLTGPGGTHSREVVPVDGRFRIEGVPPGDWRIAFQAGGLRQAVEPHRRLYVAAVRMGSRDGMWTNVAVTESGNPPIDVILSDAVGQVAGTVADAGMDAVIVVRRADQQSNLSGLIMPRHSNGDGSFLVPDLLPGLYEVTALIPNTGGFTTTGLASLCGDRSAKVKVVAGETAVVRLAVCNR